MNPDNDELWLTEKELARKRVMRGQSESDPDLIADERNEEMLDAITSGDLGKLTRLMNGVPK